MTSFCPPLRKRLSVEKDEENDENLTTDELEGSLQFSEGQASAQNSQEVLSCGFLPPKQRKRTPFRPPLRDLVSPGQSYISRILHEDNNEHGRVTPSGLTSSFQLAPLDNVDSKDNEECTMFNAPKKHRYYYHIGNKRIEQPVKTIAQKKPAETTNTSSKRSTSALNMDKNESRLKIFEFQLSQATKSDKPSCETSKPHIKPLAQVFWYICLCTNALIATYTTQHHVSMDIYHAVKRAREEIREIRKRYAAKKAHCFIQGTMQYQRGLSNSAE